jgi:DNA polymerase III delta prime subunit
MSGVKLVGLIVIGLLLFGVVGAANVVTTAERTVLDADYVDEQLESGGAYESIRETTIDSIVDRLENANLGEGQQLLQAGEETDSRTLVADALTEEYIQEQASDNIRELYAYLHGEQDSLGMEIDMEPLKDNLADSFAAQIEEKNTSTLVEEFGPDSSETPVPIDGSLVEQMRSSPEGYEQAREDFRVDLGFEVTDNDEKLVLIGEDPRQYSEEEKEQIVQNREQEIRDAIRHEIRDSSSELSSRVRQEVQERRGTAKDRICQATVDELNPDAGQEICSPLYEDSSDTTHLDNVSYAAVQLQYVIVDGLTRQQVQYDYNQFNTDLSQSENHLSTETGDLARDRIEQEVPDTLNASDQFGSDATNQFESAQNAVEALDTLYLVLPVVALLLIGLAFVVTRSLETTATFTGIVLTLVGGLFLVVATVLGDRGVSEVESTMQNGDAAGFADIVVALIESVLGVLATQSTVVLVVGIVLIVLAYLSKSGRLPVPSRG